MWMPLLASARGQMTPPREMLMFVRTFSLPVSCLRPDASACGLLSCCRCHYHRKNECASGRVQPSVVLVPFNERRRRCWRSNVAIPCGGVRPIRGTTSTHVAEALGARAPYWPWMAQSLGWALTSVEASVYQLHTAVSTR